MGFNSAFKGLIDLPDHQVIMITVTDGYISFLLLVEGLRSDVDSRRFHWNL